jgi:glucuronate isomerase
MLTQTWQLSPDRCFSPEPRQRELARELYGTVKDLPLVCPHGHVAPELLGDPAAKFGSLAELLIIPDHYVFRMLYSQGVRLEDLGVPARDGREIETDHRAIWRRFCENYHLFRGTPTGLWFGDVLTNLFGLPEKPSAMNADRLYDILESRLHEPEFQPRALFQKFNIEVLCTTDAPWDSLEYHQSLRAESGVNINMRPTFRPDGVVNLDNPAWAENMQKLETAWGREIGDYKTFVRCLEERRAFFKELGATATDHAALSAHTQRLSENEAAEIFRRAKRGEATPHDAARFTAHMLVEMARMSTEDGLVMQLHVGSYRNHNPALFAAFGTDKGADIPTATEWTHNLRGLLDAFGNDPRLTLILFCLDETTYSRELAPLAGHYPALRLGPPWWFHDSVNGMERYLENVMETAGLYNTAGFNDDTRAFASIPARHDVWRRVTCNWLAGMVGRGLIDEEDAAGMARAFAYDLAKEAYKL